MLAVGEPVQDHARQVLFLSPFSVDATAVDRSFVEVGMPSPAENDHIHLGENEGL